MSVRLVALLLLAVAAPLAAASRLGLAGLGVDVCETYSHEECALHPDKCTPCRAWDRVDVCFETAIAKRLPSKLFACDFPPVPPPEPTPQPQPDVDCQTYTTEDTCSAKQGCVWCMSAAVRSACYTEEEAKRLPAAVFRCKFPSLAAEQ
ncbi:hypothetical protein COHA_004924 [Chlorella ohadii]|uniref:Uncharacterized protein n=1 Tax=Chlorella ohadii TaxID=2649997 RepID=A0AAD5DSP9_9CHLO|nr:hypothetical protein COHA_004924 [Chlorella ohadii]